MIVLPYGTSEIRGRLPAGAGRPVTLGPRRVRKARDPAACVRRALARPTGSPPLVDLARGAGDCVIVVSDHTRRTALRDVLPAVFESLVALEKEAGVARARTSILVAYGNHERVSTRRIRALTGPLPRGVRVVHHDSSSRRDLVDVGPLPSGARLQLNARALEADCLVVTGAITFHYHAGFTGGRKAFLPGLASRANVLANHSRTLDPGSASGREASCRPGRLRGNPVHEQMCEAARLVTELREKAGRRAPFLVNTVLAEDGGLAAAFAGDIFDAFEEGAAWVGARFRVELARPFDVAMASAGGAPRDATFYQAHKAFDGASRAVRDGGAVVLAAECPDGPGAGLLEWFRHASYAGHLAALTSNGGERFAVPGQTALALREKLARVRGVLVSRIPPADVRAMGLVPARDLDGALAEALDLIGSGKAPRICVIPHASTTLPHVSGEKRR